METTKKYIIQKEARQLLKKILIATYFLLIGILFFQCLNTYIFEDEYSFFVNVAHFTANKTIVPRFTNYPTFYSYFLTIPSAIVFWIITIGKGFVFSDLWQDPGMTMFLLTEHDFALVLVGRILSSLLAVAIYYYIIKFCNNRYGQIAALATGLLVLLDPSGMFIRFACYALPETLIAFLVAAVCYCCLRFAETNDENWLYRGSIACGFAMGAKFNAAMAVFPLLAAPLLWRTKNRFILYAKIFSVVVLSFFISTPLLFLYPECYANGFAVEKDILLSSGKSGINYFKLLWIVKNIFAANPLLFFLLAASVIHSVLKWYKEDKIFLSILIPSVFILGSLKKETLSYFFILYPLMAIQAGRTVQALFTFLKRINKPLLKRIAAAGIVLIYISFLPGFYKNVSRRLRPDSRVLAKKWIHQNIPSETTILVDWLYTPRLLKSQHLQNLKNRASQKSKNLLLIEKYFSENPHYELIEMFRDIKYDLNHPSAQKADYLITSNKFYKRFYQKKGDQILYGLFFKGERVESIRMFYERLLKNELEFQLIKEFTDGTGSTTSIFKRKKETKLGDSSRDVHL